ncbi:MAG: hypothetical protein ACYC6Y_24220, partial [Thermoguttaceae bacterium]
MLISVRRKAVLLTIVVVGLGAVAGWAQQSDIDWNRARQLRQRALRGETLPAEDRAYLERAIEMRQRQQPQRAVGAVKPFLELVPLCDMRGEERYRGQEGGLYGGGKNEPPEEHLQAALQQAGAIRPLGKDGRPADDGRIVFVSVGMSNTTQEFSQFVPLADEDPAKEPRVLIVDGAQGG